jgi:hypothetical protein
VQALYLGAGTSAMSRNVAIRVTTPDSLKLSWLGQSNAFYRVEWRSSASTGAWTNLGLPVLSNGGTNSVTDSLVGQTQKFFRIHPLP